MLRKPNVDLLVQLLWWWLLSLLMGATIVVLLLLLEIGVLLALRHCWGFVCSADRLCDSSVVTPNDASVFYVD